jgi:hypothetical protein
MFFCLQWGNFYFFYFFLPPMDLKCFFTTYGGHWRQCFFASNGVTLLIFFCFCHQWWVASSVFFLFHPQSGVTSSDVFFTINGGSFQMIFFSATNGGSLQMICFLTPNGGSPQVMYFPPPMGGHFKWFFFLPPMGVQFKWFISPPPWGVISSDVFSTTNGGSIQVIFFHP